MEFEKQAIRTASPFGSTSTPAMVGVGTGLAYVERSTGRYSLIVISCGLHFGSSTDNEQVVQRYLELVAPLTDWGRDRYTIVHDCVAKYGSESAVNHKLSELMQQARTEISQQHSIEQSKTDTDPLVVAIQDEMKAQSKLIEQLQEQVNAMQISLLALLPKQKQEEEAKICQ